MEYPHPTPSDKSSEKQRPKGMLEKIKKPAERLAQAAALAAGLAVGVDTVRPDANDYTAEGKAKQIQDIRSQEDERRRKEKSGVKSGEGNSTDI